MSRASAAIALFASPPIPSLIVPTRRSGWRGLEETLARALIAVGDCARVAWWDGSAVGLHLNGLLGLFEAEDRLHGRNRT